MPESINTHKDVDVTAYILSSIDEIKYGSVEIIIHDSKIVQVQKSEKVRFPSLAV